MDFQDDSLVSPMIHSFDHSDEVLDDDVNLPEADPSLLNGFFLVQGIMLMQLFMVCQECSTRLSPHKVRLTALGTAPVVQYYCPRCSVEGDIKRWDGQRRTIEYNHEETFLGNVLSAVSAVLTGVRFAVRFIVFECICSTYSYIMLI